MSIAKAVLFSAILFASPISANDSVVIAELDNGQDRLVAFGNTLDAYKDPDGKIIISVITHWASAPDIHIVWTMPLASCANGQGKISSQIVTPQKQDVEHYAWKKSSSKIYDIVANEFCGAAASAVIKFEKEIEERKKGIWL